MPQDGGATSPSIPRSFPLTSRDEQILAMRDEDYHLLTWEDLKKIIAANDLQALTRLPSQLKKYLTWSHEIKSQYGNMMAYLIKERLKWQPLPSIPTASSPSDLKFAIQNPIAFANEEDYTILRNDWPYGLAPGIVHICVWMKNRLPVDAENGDLLSEGRRLIEEFVDRTFVDGLGLRGEDRVQWFKNWAGLQSVRGIEHIHVLLRDVDSWLISRVLDEPSA